ncbi:MAG TPA: YicC/YloC family endoribonuclease [Cyclobacteriaceae bacterium]|nr:YicC/YloC family endoribonuclease [Cyclobacteriaceae bacterium]
MILSMTGFGKSERVENDFTLSTEVRSLNSKFFDCQLKLPKEFLSKEIELRRIIEQRLERGKITVGIDLLTRNLSQDSEFINETLFINYYNRLKDLANKIEDTSADIFKTVLFLPDVINPAVKGDAESMGPLLEDVLIEALDKCLDYRIEEGKNLSSSLKEYIYNIAENLKQIELLDPERIEQVRQKINKNIRDLIPKESFDENRFEQELIYYIEKLDISEEKVRLKSHLEYFLSAMDSDESSGKKLGFISQEIGREINTIGSKANYAVIQRQVVAMKEELEKIKEQLLNVL